MEEKDLFLPAEIVYAKFSRWQLLPLLGVTKLKSFYDRLTNNGNPAKVAIVAVIRKLLSFMHAIVKNNSSWNCNII